MRTLRRHVPALLIATCALLPVALPAGAAAAPEGTPAPQLSFAPGSYDFGLQQVHSTNQTTLQLRNDGAAPAPAQSLETTGPGSGAFWIDDSDCRGRTLEPAESCSVQVSFGPDDAIPYAAQVRASSEGASFSAGLSGEGGRPVLSPASDPTNFGAVAVGSAGVTRTIDVTNTGNMAGGVFIAVVSGGAVGSFHLLDENCTNVLLTPDATCNVQVSFQPISTGSKTARLSLFGESDGGTQINLAGIGLEPQGSPASAGLAAIGPRAQQKRHVRSRPRRRHSLRYHRHRAGLAARRATR
jgi:hypothetical protein